MRILFLFLLLNFSLINNILSQQKTVIDYYTYCNARYGYCIKYPAGLTPQPEAQNGDGRIFTNKKGIEVLRVYGARYDDFETGRYIPLLRHFSSELRGGRFKDHLKREIIYSKSGKDFFVISGTENGKIFYQKVIEQRTDTDTTVAVAFLQYTETEKVFYNEVAKMIFTSFK